MLLSLLCALGLWPLGGRFLQHRLFQNSKQSQGWQFSLTESNLFFQNQVPLSFLKTNEG